ncbi:MAG: alpha-galactosidase [Caulobacteraceae bacterium]|nr:alpha-galactosidase [Caulobacteraceae bacterium]
MAGGFLRLEGGGESLVFLIPDVGAPVLAYWGPDLGGAEAFGALSRLDDRAVPHGGLDDGEALNWLPEAGHGFTGHPALIARRGESELVSQMAVRAVDADGASAAVTLRDDLAGIEVVLTLALDAATGVLTSRAEARNLGPGPLALDWLAAGAFASPHAELMLFDGRWAREFAPVRQTLVTGLMVKENRTGRTSHHAPPFLVAGEPGFGEARGEAFGLHLAWSGDHRMFAERLRDGRIQLQAGELLRPGEIVLAEGEAYATPALYLARSAAGLNGLSDRLHPFVRDTILGGRLKGKTRPVHYNTWEAVYFDHDVARLQGLADLAAGVGIERFVLDDGWFLGRDDDTTSLGDWRVDPVKYPHGLKPLIDHVLGLGMEFGLWVEPEMANAESELIRAHPDWVLGIEGRRQPLGRRQYVLDLTRPEVSDAIFAQIDALLAEHPIAYLKWDMNRDLTHAVSGGRAAVHRQTLAVYALIDRLRAAHPGVEIESCASGGGRADYEILRRTDRIWTSDCNDPIERQSIQRAFSIFFPPEVMGAHVGPEAAHTTGRVTSLQMRAFTAFFGHMGVEADLTGFTPGRRAELREAIALHKAWRGVLHAGRTVRLEHPDPGLMAHAAMAEGRALVCAAQVETPRTAGLAPLRIAGLDADATYSLRQLNLPRRPPASMKHVPAMARGETLSASGAMLAHAGAPLPLLRAGEIAVLLLERQDA